MNIAVVVTRLPLQGIAARESLDLIFALAAVDHQLSVIFADDAVYQLLKAQDSTATLTKDFRRSFKLFELYEIDNLYVCAESLKQRNLKLDNLMLEVKPLEHTELSRLLHNQQHVIRA